MRPAVLKCEGHSRANLGSWPRESGVYSSMPMSVCTFVPVLCEFMSHRIVWGELSCNVSCVSHSCVAMCYSW